MLNFRVASGDKILEEHLSTCKKNASYHSKTVQNELIKICGDIVRDSVVREIKEACFFSVLGDEATDCSDDEEVSMVVRFVDASSNIREEFFDFVHATDLTGRGISTLVSNQWNIAGDKVR